MGGHPRRRVRPEPAAAAAADLGRSRRRATTAVRRLARFRPELTLLLALAAVLNLWALSRNGVLALLLVAPATWAVQTLGHPTSGTFPASGSVPLR